MGVEVRIPVHIGELDPTTSRGAVPRGAPTPFERAWVMGYQGKLRFMRTAGGLTHHNAVRKKITSVKVTRLVFLDDHGMLTDITPEMDDWELGGKRYVEKQGGAHWLVRGENYPASVTKATQLRIEVDLDVDSGDADPIDCAVTATPTLGAGGAALPDALTFRARFMLGGVPRVRTVMTADAPLGDFVHLALDWRLSWRVEAAAQDFDAGTTGPHRLYVTYDTPDPAGHPLVHPEPLPPDLPPREDGITEKRMHAAVDLIERMWNKGAAERGSLPEERNDPHVIAAQVMWYVEGFTLDEPPAGSVDEKEHDLIKDTYGHPQYDRAMGAWPIYAHAAAWAECQAIVRFTRGVLLQAGVPGRASYVVIYADADSPAGPSKALEDSIIPRDPDRKKYRWNLRTRRVELSPGLNRDMPRRHAGMDGQWQSLTNMVVRCPDHRTIRYGTIMNTYEACLKFEYPTPEPGKSNEANTRYYAGGIKYHTFASAQDVLRSFKQLVWRVEVVRPGDDPSKPRSRVTEIAHPIPPVRPDGEREYFEPDGDPNRFPG